MAKTLKMENEITQFQVIPGGPLKVTGPFEIQGPDGKIMKTDKTVYLCRCGHSSNKPFCDRTHKWNCFPE